MTGDAAVVDAAADLGDDAAEDGRVDVGGDDDAGAGGRRERRLDGLDLVGGQRHRGGDLGAHHMVEIEHALLERLDDGVDLVDVVVLDDQRQQAADDLRYRL